MPAKNTCQSGLSLRISVTDRCQFQCIYCRVEGPRQDGSRERLCVSDIREFVRLVGDHFDVSKVHLTGGEPLLHDGIVEIVRVLAGENVRDLALTTNGQLLPQCAIPLKDAGLRRVNVSLDTLNPATHSHLHRAEASLDSTLAGVNAATKAGLAPVKINTVVLRDDNLAEVTQLARWAVERGLSIRFIELMPVGCIRDAFSEQYVSSEEVRCRLAREFDLQPLPKAAAASCRIFRLKGGGGVSGQVGFISSISEPFCAGCQRLRLMSNGTLLGCLKEADGIPVLPLLRSDTESSRRRLIDLVDKSLQSKGSTHSFDAVETLMARGG